MATLKETHPVGTTRRLPLREVQHHLMSALENGDSGITDAIDVALCPGWLHGARDVHLDP